MTVVDWILGALFRPGSTYAHARNHLRFGYWWILLSVFTLEIVMSVYHPSNRDVDSGSVILFQMTFLMLLFDLYGVALWGAARVLRLGLPWVEALKIVGLSWSVRLLEDVITFYPVLKQMQSTIIGISAALTIWHLISLTIGLRSGYKLPLGQALILAAVACVPLRFAEIWLVWSLS